MTRRAYTLAAVLVVLVAFAGVGLAITGGVGVSGTVNIDAPNGPSVDVVTNGGELLLDGPAGDDVVEVTHDNGEATFTGPAGSTAQVDTTELEGDFTRVLPIDAAGGTVTVNPADKPAASVSGSITELEFRDAGIDNGQIDAQVAGTGTLTLRGLAASTDIAAVDSAGNLIDQTTTTSGGEATIQISDSGSTTVELVTSSAPVVDEASATPSGGVTVSQTPVELSVNVSDADFAGIQSDSVEVTFYDASDDSQLGSDTLSENGTAKTQFDSPDGGTNDWYAVATDSYGNEVTTQTFTFNAPSELRIYSETNPTQLIDGDVSLRVRFFIGEDEGTVIERSATDGTISLEGLPVDERFIATVRANETSEFTYRRIVVDSLIETQDVYLLNRSEPNSEIIYQLDDPTGEFPPEETVLYVEKPITKDFDGDGTNETRYETIAGDVFGASAQFPVILQQDTRYRLRVESDGGSSRILGAYSVTGDAVEPLQIQRVQLQGDADGDATLSAVLEGEGQNRQIAIRYRDFGNQTESVTYRVVDQRTGEVYVTNTTREAQVFADLYPLPENSTVDEESFAVEYTITRGDEVRSGKVFAGDLPEVAQRFGLEQNVLRVLSVLFILATMGLVVLVSPILAPLAGTVVAALLSIVGAFGAPMPVIGFAGAVSVLVIVGGNQ